MSNYHNKIRNDYRRIKRQRIELLKARIGFGFIVFVMCLFYFFG